MEEWVEQLQNSVNTLDKLKSHINVTPEEEEAITTLNTKWGTTPYFVSLMRIGQLGSSLSMRETK